MSKPPKSQRIFISYKREDREFASWLASQLRDKGYNIWIDIFNLKSGRWVTKLRQELDTSGGIIVILSHNTLTDPTWVILEYQRASKLKLFIYPIVLDNYTVNDIEDRVPDFWGISGNHGVHFTDRTHNDTKINEIIQALNAEGFVPSKAAEMGLSNYDTDDSGPEQFASPTKKIELPTESELSGASIPLDRFHPQQFVNLLISSEGEDRVLGIQVIEISGKADILQWKKELIEKTEEEADNPLPGFIPVLFGLLHDKNLQVVSHIISVLDRFELFQLQPSFLDLLLYNTRDIDELSIIGQIVNIIDRLVEDLDELHVIKDKVSFYGHNRLVTKVNDLIKTREEEQEEEKSEETEELEHRP